MKKQNIIYTIIIAFITGFILSWLIFAKSDDKRQQAETQGTVSQNEEQIWTCSMHPQIRQNEPGLCPICEMDLIPLEGNTSNDPLVLEMTQSAVALANIQTSIVGPKSNSDESPIKLAGRIKPDERRISNQVSHVPGRIEKLYVSFTGEEVYKGQKLAEVYSPELITAQRELIEASKMTDNKSLLEATRNKLRNWKIPQETIEEIENSGKAREVFPIYAAESGVVSNRKVSIGDYVSQGGVLFELTNLRKLWVLFDAYEKDLSRIILGQDITFTSSSYPDKSFSSKVSFIDPIIDPQTRVATVRTEISNSSGILKPEMFVTGSLASSSKKSSDNSILVPKSAVMWTGKRSVLYVKLQDREIPSFEFREVELGKSMGDKYQILSGIEEGEEIVSSGSFVIDAAAQLNNQSSMINRDVTIKKELSKNPDFSQNTPQEFKTQIHRLADAYLKIKDALVESASEKATEKTAQFTKALQEIDMALLQSEAHMFWMDQLNILKQHSQKLAESQNLEDQRKQFEFLSDALIATIESFGMESGKLYVQYCPMAFNNKGGTWLSSEKQIKNPFFGDKMMKCGVVKDILE